MVGGSRWQGGLPGGGVSLEEGGGGCHGGGISLAGGLPGAVRHLGQLRITFFILKQHHIVVICSQQ